MRKLLVPIAASPVVFLMANSAVAEPVDPGTTVTHDYTFTESFGDDICGDRANTTTFHRKVEQVQFFQLTDGTFFYRDVAAVTYESDYVDPSIPDVSGRLTEVNRFILNPGEVFVGTTTFHDFFGDVRIWYRLHITEQDGEPVVVREVQKVTGCP